MKLYIIRHGQSKDNAEAIQFGDRGLTQLGVQQALATAEALTDIPIDTLYVSPTRRTLETACILSKALPLTPIVRADICERNWLYDEPGLSSREMAELCAGLCVGPEFAPDSGWARDRNVESGDELYQRAQSVLLSLRAEHPNGSGTVALVTHAQFSGYLISVALGFSRRQVETNWLRMYNCGISHLEFRDHATMMWYLNAHSHIGAPVTA